MNNNKLSFVDDAHLVVFQFINGNFATAQQPWLEHLNKLPPGIEYQHHHESPHDAHLWTRPSRQPVPSLPFISLPPGCTGISSWTGWRVTFSLSK